MKNKGTEVEMVKRLAICRKNACIRSLPFRKKHVT